MMNSAPDRSPPPVDLTLKIVLLALDATIAELAQYKGVSYGRLRHEIMLQATLDAAAHSEPESKA